jgi:hypothetical protein
MGRRYYWKLLFRKSAVKNKGKTGHSGIYWICPRIFIYPIFL